jgi:WD40 repeat protein
MGNCISSSPASAYEVDSHNTTPDADSAHPPQPLKQLSQLHTDIVFAVATTPASSTLCSASADGCIRVFDWDTDRILHTYRHDKSVHKLHFNASTQMLFSGSRDTTVKHWNLNSDHEQCVQTFRGHELVVMGLATNTGTLFFLQLSLFSSFKFALDVYDVPYNSE